MESDSTQSEEAEEEDNGATANEASDKESDSSVGSTISGFADVARASKSGKMRRKY